MTAELKRLETERHCKPYHASVPFEAVSLLTSSIVELRLLAHTALNNIAQVGRVQMAASLDMPKGKVLAQIRTLQDLSFKLYPPRVLEDDEEPYRAKAMCRCESLNLRWCLQACFDRCDSFRTPRLCLAGGGVRPRSKRT